jgi:hypothetical protein
MLIIFLQIFGVELRLNNTKAAIQGALHEDQSNQHTASTMSRSTATKQGYKGIIGLPIAITMSAYMAILKTNIDCFIV